MAKNNWLKIDIREWFEREKDDFQDDFVVYPKRKLLFFSLVLFVLCFGMFEVWLKLSSTTVQNLDLLIENFVDSWRNSFGAYFFYTITLLGSQYFIIGAGCLLAIPLFLRRRRKAAVTFLVALLATVFLVVILKSLIARDRPNGCLVIRDCYSFPSGHAALAFYFYGMVSYLLERFIGIRNKFLYVWIVGVSLLVFLIAFSRIYLGYHFFSDIVAGFLLGGICWLAAAILIDIFYDRYR